MKKGKSVTRKVTGVQAAVTPEAMDKALAKSLPPTGIPGESHAWQSALLFFGIIGALLAMTIWGGLEFWSRVHGG